MVTGTGPRSRIIAADIEDAIKNGVNKPKAAAAVAAPAKAAKAAAKKADLADESGQFVDMETS